MASQTTPAEAPTISIYDWWHSGSSGPSVLRTARAVSRVPRRAVGLLPGYLRGDKQAAQERADRQARLQQLAGIAALRYFLPRELKENRSKGTNILSILNHERITGRGRIVDVRPFVAATDKESRLPMLTSARALSREISNEDRARSATEADTKPIIMEPGQGLASVVYGALDRAAADVGFEVMKLTRGEEDTRVPDPSVIAIMSHGVLVRALRGAGTMDYARIAVLETVDDTVLEHSRWSPRYTVPWTSERQETTVSDRQVAGADRELAGVPA